MASSANNIVIAPSNVTWKIQGNWQFDYAGLAAASLDGVYYTLNSPSGAFYVWHNLDSSSVDPAPAGLTAIEVAVTTGDSPTVIATAAAAAIDAVADFAATSSAALVDVTAADFGQATDPADVDSGVSVIICRKGKEYDLGLIEGDTEIAFTPSLFDVTSQQTGTTITASLVQGFEAEVTTVLQETTRSQLSEIYSIYGGQFLPGGGTEVTGVGSAAIGKNLLVEAGRLEFNPVNDLGSELSYKVTLMLCAPVPDSLLLSGESPRTLSVTWRAFIDDTVADSRANFLVIGDAFQSGL
jgi:hypothetical protein